MDRMQQILRLRRWGACGASSEIIRGEAREKKSVGFVDEGGKVSRGAEVKYIDIVLFVVLISALYVQESDGIVCCLYVLYLNQS